MFRGRMINATRFVARMALSIYGVLPNAFAVLKFGLCQGCHKEAKEVVVLS